MPSISIDDIEWKPKGLYVKPKVSHENLSDEVTIKYECSGKLLEVHSSDAGSQTASSPLHEVRYIPGETHVLKKFKFQHRAELKVTATYNGRFTVDTGKEIPVAPGKIYNHFGK